jgi:hypothetical protein
MVTPKQTAIITGSLLLGLDGELINGQTIRVNGGSSNPWSFLQPTHPMIQRSNKTEEMTTFPESRTGFRASEGNRAVGP